MKNLTEKDVKDTAKDIKGDFMTQFNEIINDAERLLKETAEVTDGKTTELREQLTSKIKDMRDSMGEHVMPFCKKGKEAFEVTDEYVKAHPWVSVGVAAATAFVVAHFCRRH
ncbi:DUF883 family protein [Entomomonas asaccharolytica]|uniref:DUF883 domain-containing protein n=1 Tax=Entomomonas asaccharolytica TaxID=2785331 RepID=A0A974RW78_9GAMM|nr:DUF883 family protein [Entomomonas asaccharolytica]QQP84832.1 DUF883 domain-containing protein [Entomomonas asaccharolytica]